MSAQKSVVEEKDHDRYIKNGVVCIFTHDEFHNSDEKYPWREKDEQMILERFKGLDLTVKDPFVNFTSEQVKKQLEEIASWKEYDCFIIFVMTHFAVTGKYLSKDGTYTEDDVLEKFKENTIPAIFFLHAPNILKLKCSDNCEKDGSRSDVHQQFLPTDVNLYVVRSCIPDIYKDRGSLFIYLVCKELKGLQSLTNEVRNVKRRIDEINVADGKKMIIPDVTSTMLKRIFLFDAYKINRMVNTKTPTYDKGSKNGYVYIYNYDNPRNEVTKLNESRDGTHADCKKIKAVFEELNFKVKIKHNWSKKKLEKKTKKDKDFESSKCLITIVLTHGMNGRLNTTTKSIDSFELIANIQANKSLMDKPKIFIFQTCRGLDASKAIQHQTVEEANIENDETTEEESESISNENYQLNECANGISTDATVFYSLNGENKNMFSNPIIKYKDVLAFFASANSKASFRDPDEGSWLIQSLCDELKKATTNNKTALFQDVVIATQRAVSQKTCMHGKQMPVVISTLTKGVAIGKNKRDYTSLWYKVPVIVFLCLYLYSFVQKSGDL